MTSESGQKSGTRCSWESQTNVTLPLPVVILLCVLSGVTVLYIIGVVLTWATDKLRNWLFGGWL